MYLSILFTVALALSKEELYMEKRIFLHRKGSTMDSILTYVGLVVSIGYVCIILAIVCTLVIGSWKSIKQFSFSFLLGTQWNVRTAVARTPNIDVEKGVITLRFSSGVSKQSFEQTIVLTDTTANKRVVLMNPHIQDRTLSFTAELPDANYELILDDKIKNTTGYPLLYSYTYTFTIKNGKVYDSNWVQHETALSRSGGTMLYGAVPFLLGTVLTSVLAMIFSVPFALALAIYLNEYEKKTKKAYILSSISDILAGIPSVVYGFWGMFFLAPYFGSNIFTASLVLAIMSLPYSTAMTREAIALVPDTLRYAGFAMGATKYAVLLHVVIPYARSGIIAGVVLALGRALGETLAVTMVIGNSNRMSFSLFEPAQTIASLIANEYAESSGIKQSALIEMGLLLICVTVFFALLSRFLIRPRRDT